MMEIQGKEHHHHVYSTKDDFADEFQCCICLDLLHKPVVVACGHMACFWCIFKAMDFCDECPVCRTPYNYFPRICRLLHLILRKLYPSAYARREKEVSEEEEKSGNVSQQFDDLKYEASDSISSELLSDSLKSVKLSSETAREVSMQQNGQTSYALPDGNNMQVVISDLACAICKQLLYRPVVLNCGDVYCEACIFNSSDSICKCPVCQSPHPNGFPNVCLVLEHFLEWQFPEEYAVRRESSREHVRPSRDSNKPAQSSTSADAYSSWLSGEGPIAHFAGCDYCGMCPIIGKRYRCKDCKEKMGFDLCEGCYNSSCKFPGRFNQQHTEDHQFEIMEPSIIDVIQMIAAGNGLNDQSTMFTPEVLNRRDIGADPARELGEGFPSISSTNDESEQTSLNTGNSSEDEGTDSRT